MGEVILGQSGPAWLRFCCFVSAEFVGSGVVHIVKWSVWTSFAHGYAWISVPLSETSCLSHYEVSQIISNEHTAYAAVSG